MFYPRCYFDKGLSTKEFLKQSLGFNIRTRREELGLSQRELANRCGLNRMFIHYIEIAERSTSSANLYEIALALETSIASLFSEVDIEIEKQIVKNKIAYDNLILQYMNLPKKFLIDNYDDVTRIYEFFKHSPESSKRYLYDSKCNNHLDRIFKDHVWRKYKQNDMVIGTNRIKEFRNELAKQSYHIPQLVGLNPVTPYNELSIE